MSLKWKIVIAFIGVAGIVLPWPLLAGVCAQRVVKQRVVQQVYAQPVYQQVAYQQAYASPYSYAIGSDLVLEALAEKLALRIEERLIQKQQAAAPPRSLVAEKCARCHSPKSKAVLEDEAPVFFSEIGELIATPEQRASMKTAAFYGNMPKQPLPELDPDEYLQLVQELKQGIAPVRDPVGPQRWVPQRTVPQSEPQRAPPPPSEELPQPPAAPPGQ